MRTIYIDSEFKCHIDNDGTRTAVDITFFDGKCDAFVEGYCYDTSSGYTYIYPWKDYAELNAAQIEYERQLLAEYKENIKEYEANLAELDALILDYQYNNLMEGL